MNPYQETFTAVFLVALVIALIPPVLLWLLGKRWTIIRKKTGTRNLASAGSQKHWLPYLLLW